jgi:hypothetical protein
LLFHMLVAFNAGGVGYIEYRTQTSLRTWANCGRAVAHVLSAQAV